MRPHVDQHFAGTLDLNDERLMRAHLSICEQCARRYDRQLLLGKLDPQALSQMERMGRPLGVGARQPRPNRNYLLALGGAALAAAALLLMVRSPRSNQNDGLFSPRGPELLVQDSSLASESVEIYRVPQSTNAAVRARAADFIERGDALAFAYNNRKHYQRLLIFGVDEHQTVYWFHPQWTDATQNPVAIPIAEAADFIELPQAVKHDFRGRHLDIHIVFLNEAMSVRDVETAIDGGAKWPSDSFERVFSLRVRP